MYLLLLKKVGFFLSGGGESYHATIEATFKSPTFGESRNGTLRDFGVKTKDSKGTPLEVSQQKPLKMNRWKMSFLLARPPARCYINFGECTFLFTVFWGKETLLQVVTSTKSSFLHWHVLQGNLGNG